MYISKMRATIALGVLLASMLLITSCGPAGRSSGHFFSFPPGSDPDEGDWEYLGAVEVVSYGSSAERSDKTVYVTVEDVDDRVLLDDKLEFTCADLQPEVVWEEKEEFVVELAEVGTASATDDYNRDLTASGPKELARVTYRYNSDLGQYERAR